MGSDLCLLRVVRVFGRWYLLGPELVQHLCHAVHHTGPSVFQRLATGSVLHRGHALGISQPGVRCSWSPSRVHRVLSLLVQGQDHMVPMPDTRSALCDAAFCPHMERPACSVEGVNQHCMGNWDGMRILSHSLDQSNGVCVFIQRPSCSFLVQRIHCAS